MLNNMGPADSEEKGPETLWLGTPTSHQILNPTLQVKFDLPKCGLPGKDKWGGICINRYSMCHVGEKRLASHLNNESEWIIERSNPTRFYLYLPVLQPISVVYRVSYTVQTADSTSFPHTDSELD